jgi:hypothetical protein
MEYDQMDAIMLEVEKLNQLVMDTCPEVFDNRVHPELEDLDLKQAVASLNQHRLNILSEISGVIKSH